MIIESKRISDVSETLQEFILHKSIPMPKNTITMISAKGGIGKTNLSLLLTSEYINEHDGNVALWLTEDEEGNIKHRINKLIESQIIREFDESRAKLIVNNPVHLAKIINREFVKDSISIDALKIFCVENDIRLFVIDPLLAFFGGNENDNSQARTFMQPFIEWCKEISINIVFIHHSSKGELSNTRGAGAFIDAVRCAYTISNPIKTGLKTVEEDKTKIAEGIRTVCCTKDNRGVIPIIFKHNGSNPFDMQIVPPLDKDYIDLIEIGKTIANNIIIKKNEPITIMFESDDIELVTGFEDD